MGLNFALKTLTIFITLITVQSQTILAKQGSCEVLKKIATIQQSIIRNQVVGIEIEGEASTHIAGNFYLLNANNKIIKVRFIGTLHDWLYTNNGFVVSDEEKAFIDSFLLHQPNKESLSEKLFVEQGGGNFTKKNVYDFLLKKGYTQQSQNTNFYTEFDYVVDQVGNAQNFDLRHNIDAPLYLLNTLKYDYADVIQTMRKEISPFLQDKPQAINEWTSLLKLPLAIKEVYKKGKPIELTGSMRDIFMSTQILNSNHDLLIVTHTRHVIAILGLLAKNIRDIELTKNVVLLKLARKVKTPAIERWIMSKHDPNTLITDKQLDSCL